MRDTLPRPSWPYLRANPEVISSLEPSQAAPRTPLPTPDKSLAVPRPHDLRHFRRFLSFARRLAAESRSADQDWSSRPVHISRRSREERITSMTCSRFTRLLFASALMLLAASSASAIQFCEVRCTVSTWCGAACLIDLTNSTTCGEWGVCRANASTSLQSFPAFIQDETTMGCELASGSAAVEVEASARP